MSVTFTAGGRTATAQASTRRRERAVDASLAAGTHLASSRCWRSALRTPGVSVRRAVAVRRADDDQSEQRDRGARRSSRPWPPRFRHWPTGSSRRRTWPPTSSIRQSGGSMPNVGASRESDGYGRRHRAQLIDGRIKAGCSGPSSGAESRGAERPTRIALLTADDLSAIKPALVVRTREAFRTDDRPMGRTLLRGDLDRGALMWWLRARGDCALLARGASAHGDRFRASCSADRIRCATQRCSRATRRACWSAAPVWLPCR